MLKTKNEQIVERCIDVYEHTNAYKFFEGNKTEFKEYLTLYFKNALVGTDKSVEFKSKYDELSAKYYDKADQAVLANIVNLMKRRGPSKALMMIIRTEEVEAKRMNQDPKEKLKENLEHLDEIVDDEIDRIKKTTEMIKEEIKDSRERRKKIDEDCKAQFKESIKATNRIAEEIKKGFDEKAEADRRKRQKPMTNLEAYSKIAKHHIGNAFDSVCSIFGF